MNKYEKGIFNTIYENINKGANYGTIDKPLNPVLDYVTSVRISISPDKKYIRYSHYGSSATKNTKKDLEWILETIFKMNPSEFIKAYTITSID